MRTLCSFLLALLLFSSPCFVAADEEPIAQQADHPPQGHFQWFMEQVFQAPQAIRNSGRRALRAVESGVRGLGLLVRDNGARRRFGKGYLRGGDRRRSAKFYAYNIVGVASGVALFVVGLWQESPLIITAGSLAFSIIEGGIMLEVGRDFDPRAPHNQPNAI